MADWTTISSLATAGGTLVLAIATFGAVRSANRSAKVTERALLAGVRPVLVSSNFDDSPVKAGFSDDHWMKVPGGRAAIDVTDEAIYLVMSLRNVGAGLAVLDRWDLSPERLMGEAATWRDPVEFRRLTRDIYVPAGNVGFWQGALRDPSEPLFAAARDAIAAGQTLTVDLLYRDHEGGQRTITRFALIPDGNGGWLATPGRHWNLDRDDPR